MKYFRRKAVSRTRRNSLLLIAVKNFPGSLLKTGIGITLLAAPFLLTIFADLGVTSLAQRIALNGLIIVVVPTSVLYIITLFRAPRIRRRNEEIAASELSAVSEGLRALKDREQREGEEIVRLQQVVTSDINERRVKDLKEEERWDLLNERLRVQEESGQLKHDLGEEREVAQKELASDDLLAQQVKDLKEDERWELLNESLRARQVEAGKRNDDMKEEREQVREKLASGVLKAQQVKNRADDERWNTLHERLRVQEERGKERDEEQSRRDDEMRQDRREDQLRNKYEALLTRYIRHAVVRGLSMEVADGLAPIPEDWLKEQPEIKREPSLLKDLVAINAR